MNALYHPPLVLPCWINGYRSATGGTWHGDPHPSLEEAIERARGVEKAGRSRLVYRWHAHAKGEEPRPAMTLAEAVADVAEKLTPFPPIIGRMPTFVPSSPVIPVEDFEVLLTPMRAVAAPAYEPLPSSPVAPPAPKSESPPAPVPAPAKAKPAPKVRAVAEPRPETTFQEPARNTRKTGNTQKDTILDAYGTTGDLPAVLAARLDVVRTTVVSTIAAAREDRDPRIAAGDRRATVRRSTTQRKGIMPAPAPKAGAVDLGKFAIPRGKACLVDESQGVVFGPIGKWGVSVKVARLLNLMSDGSLYGPHVMEKAGYARGALEDTLRPMKAKLASIGVKLSEVPKVGFRLEIAE